ncbi:MAG TPA: redox-regulated ATPase YchF [Thermodesulfobacteriaceae bacterium]|nr:redox-regulated ATPase YchF [Thermodesulfobacteriaceae bacterium]
MKTGIVGLPGAGKTTIFNALTSSEAEISAYSGGRKEPNLAIVLVPDHRLDRLSSIYNPRKTTPAQIQYVDIGGSVSAGEGANSSMNEILTLLRPVDALVHVVRNFDRAGEASDPQSDLKALESELIFTDLVIAEKRVERLEKEIKKGGRGDPKELKLLQEALDILNLEQALRTVPYIAASPLLRGYAFLSAKPCIVVLNSDEDKEPGQTEMDLPPNVVLVELKGKLEMELAQLAPDEAELFRRDLGLKEPATFRLIKESYSLLGLISFFTVGEDEVKAWTIRKGTPARKAAATIHSDIEKGFIRAEVVSCEDLFALGDYASAQKAGKTRLEGKDYQVQDGDVINFRFNV